MLVAVGTINYTDVPETAQADRRRLLEHVQSLLFITTTQTITTTIRLLEHCSRLDSLLLLFYYYH